MLRLIPSICAFWNAVKGGSDTTTKLMDDSCVLRVPKSSLNTETAAITRLLMVNLSLIHRLFQIFSAKDDLHTYASLNLYRHAANERRSFHESLVECGENIEEEIKQIEIEEQNEANKENIPPPGTIVQPPPRRQQQRRRQPLRQRVDGVLPERLEFGACLPTKTPTKLKRREGKVPDELQSMFTSCRGIPMKSHPVQHQRCFHCKQKTSWHCVGCKRWLCLERKVLKKKTENNGGIGEMMDLYEHGIKGKVVNFQKVCFHHVHEEAWVMDTTDKLT